MSFLASKIWINVDSLNIYNADFRCVPELLKILSIFHNGPRDNNEVMEQIIDFTLPIKFDNKKTKEIAKEIMQHGQELYVLLGKEKILDKKMNSSIEIIE